MVPRLARDGTDLSSSARTPRPRDSLQDHDGNLDFFSRAFGPGGPGHGRVAVEHAERHGGAADGTRARPSPGRPHHQIVAGTLRPRGVVPPLGVVREGDVRRGHGDGGVPPTLRRPLPLWGCPRGCILDLVGRGRQRQDDFEGNTACALRRLRLDDAREDLSRARTAAPASDNGRLCESAGPSDGATASGRSFMLPTLLASRRSCLRDLGVDRGADK